MYATQLLLLVQEKHSSELSFQQQEQTLPTTAVLLIEAMLWRQAAHEGQQFGSVIKEKNSEDLE